MFSFENRIGAIGTALLLITGPSDAIPAPGSAHTRMPDPPAVSIGETEKNLGGAATPSVSGEPAAPAGPAFRPIYVNKAGDGILRYSAPDGAARKYWLSIGMHTSNPQRPFETWTGGIGPFSGPNVAISFPYIKHSQIPLDAIAFELYETDPYRMAARFKPVIAPDRAEPASACGKISRIGACTANAP